MFSGPLGICGSIYMKKIHNLILFHPENRRFFAENRVKSIDTKKSYEKILKSEKMGIRQANYFV